MSQQYPDPIAEGLQHSGQRMVQIVSAAVGVQQSFAQRRSRSKAVRQAKQAKADQAQARLRRAALAEARSRWGRAHDNKWLRQANLLDVAEAWGAAVPYADGNASAALAVRKCEERLRRLHPHAMSHYDRLRAEGTDALQAMEQAAPFFSRDPNVRTGDPAPERAELHEGTGAEWAARVHGPDRAEWEEARQEQRATQIADELRTNLRSQGRDPQPEELRVVLEITTNLPDHVIAKAVPADPCPRPTRDVERAADDFPFSINEALEMSAKQPFEAPAQRRTSPQTPERNRRRNL
ncbi:hypothetical protein [Actinomadura bangladeshensis]|uniref:Uncharacterized protein n=1 Tax=Actinomadura bangladeshensis TaxID=453573 RepID=A0A4V2XN93_9ACTN|nr:hypothetical protein [Actinomadura bangladeshensis]TDC17236.1 hypothetical protein E1284_09795 [Actinomadura bangladeshensis]